MLSNVFHPELALPAAFAEEKRKAAKTMKIPFH
jgi:hypothetical protein